MEKTIVNEVVSALEAVKSYGQPGFWILLVSILIVLVLVIAAVVYQRIVIKRFQTASKATQDFETVAADLRRRALEVKKQDEGLRQRELEVKERKQQQQVLKRSQRALKGSVSHTITLGLAGKRVPNNEKK
jgi:predicted Holliday junction resolvase-like endonuclease